MSDREEIIKNNVKWLRPLDSKKTNVWERKANKIVRDFLRCAVIPSEEKKQQLRAKRKKKNRKN